MIAAPMFALMTQSGCVEEESIDAASLTVELRNTGEGLAQVESNPFHRTLFELIHDDSEQSFHYTRDCLSDLCPSVTGFSNGGCLGDIPPTNIQTLKGGDTKVVEWDGLWFRETEQGCTEPYQARVGETYTVRMCELGADCLEETLTLGADENRVTFDLTGSEPPTETPIEIEVRNDTPFAITLQGATPTCENPNAWLTLSNGLSGSLPNCSQCRCDAPSSCEATCDSGCTSNEEPLTLEPGQSYIYDFPGFFAARDAPDGSYLNLDEQSCAYPSEAPTEALLDNPQLKFGTTLSREQLRRVSFDNDARLEGERLIISATATIDD